MKIIRMEKVSVYTMRICRVDDEGLSHSIARVDPYADGYRIKFIQCSNRALPYRVMEIIMKAFAVAPHVKKGWKRDVVVVEEQEQKE